jgi:glycosyltransferase involved in cell wall biosynthesis
VEMERLTILGWQGVIKRLEYRRLFLTRLGNLHGLLATGHSTADWVVQRGMPRDKVFSFAYFLAQPPLNDPLPGCHVAESRVRFVFVGQLVERKRLGLLIQCLASLGTRDFQLAVVGSGPMFKELRSKAEHLLPGRVDWIGVLPAHAVAAEISRADCLVLPSRHDGWGAVVSEALMAGTPAICSDRCGAAGVVLASGVGGVFLGDERDGLVGHLKGAMQRGRVTGKERLRLARWARCLNATTGADYLLDVLAFSEGRRGRPKVPWENGAMVSGAAAPD